MVVSAARAGDLEEPRSLVRRCLSGEMAAWRDLHRSHYPIAIAFLRKLGVRDRDVDDACQEVFLEMFRNLGKYRGDAELKTWMYRICASQASRYHRRWKVLSRLIEAFESGGGGHEAIGATDPAAVDARRALEAGLSCMSAGERLVFVLFELEGVPGAQVAEIAGCPVNTVWRRLFDARKKLRASMGLPAEGAPS